MWEIKEESVNITLYDLLMEIQEALIDEHDAVSKYYKLWKLAELCYKNKQIHEEEFQELMDDIKEAISEELKHIEMFNRQSEFLSGIKPEI